MQRKQKILRAATQWEEYNTNDERLARWPVTTQPSAKKGSIDAELTDLIALCALADRQALARLYQTTSAQLFGVLLRILKRTDWAEDALQETYLRVWQHAATYRPGKGAPWPWLVSIARYRALDMLRSQRRSPLAESDGSEHIEKGVAIGSEIGESLALAVLDKSA